MEKLVMDCLCFGNKLENENGSFSKMSCFHCNKEHQLFFRGSLLTYDVIKKQDKYKIELINLCSNCLKFIFEWKNNDDESLFYKYNLVKSIKNENEINEIDKINNILNVSFNFKNKKKMINEIIIYEPVLSYIIYLLKNNTLKN